MTDRAFRGVAVYVTGFPTVVCAVSFRRVIFGAYGYIREDAADGPSPFESDEFAITPLSEPYITEGGHHIFSIAYYSELTVVDASDRLCFHDPTQELGISLNFPSKKDFQACFEYLHSELTVIAPALPGFFVVQSLRRPLSDDARFAKVKAVRYRELLKDTTVEPSDQLLLAHSQLLIELTQTIGLIAQSSKATMPLASDGQLAAGFRSRDAMRELLLHSSIEESKKWRVWLFMIGLYPVDGISDSVRRGYLALRAQWNAITAAQFQRSRLVRDALNSAVVFLAGKSAEILGIVTEPAILPVVRSVVLSIVHLFRSMGDHLDTVLSLLKVFLWLFVKEIRPGPTPDFVNREGGTFDGETLEVLLFWSLLYVLEIGETRMILQQPPSYFDTGGVIGDFLNTVHYSLARIIQSQGGYGQLRPVVTSHLATILPPGKCTDTWLVGVAASNFVEFTQFMLVSALFFSFPTLLSAERKPLQETIKQAFTLIDSKYLEAASLVLELRASAMIRVNLDSGKK
jgi:hypothetical protein